MNNSNNFKGGIPLLMDILVSHRTISRLKLDEELNTLNSPKFIHDLRIKLVNDLQDIDVNMEPSEVIITGLTRHIKSNGKITKVGSYRLHPFVRDYLICERSCTE